MTARSASLKLAAAAGSAALAVSAFAAPSFAATQDITYNCTKGDPAPLGPIDTTVTSKIPAKLVAGQKDKSKVTVVVHLSAQQAALANSLGSSVKGNITSSGTDALSLKIPPTSTTPAGDGTLDVTATGNGVVSSAKAGKVKVSSGTIKAVLHLNIDASSSCKMPTDGTQVLGTTTVSKDKSKSKTSGSYNAKKDTVNATTKVSGKKFGLAGTGKVKFTLMKGSKAVKSASGKLNKKGVATAAFKKVTAAGKYTVKTKFAGDKGLKGSTGSGNVTVK